MAKMTIEGVTYEGTPEELRAIVATFEEAVEAEEPTAAPQYKTEKRRAKVGERILITLDSATAGQTYKLNDVLTVTKTNACFRGDVNVEGQSSFVDYTEYEVIVEPTQAKPEISKAPADLITHKGADYSLVQRTAQAGDVVVFTANRNLFFTIGKAYGPVTNGRSYLVAMDNDGDSIPVYSESNNRTESNVLVYEKIAVEPSLKVGDTVEVLDGSAGEYRYFVTGTVGKITDIDADLREPIRVDTSDDFDRYPASALRKMEEPDVFTKLGRKLNEFKKGDIVMTHDSVNGHKDVLGEVVGDVISGRPLVKARQTDGRNPTLFSDSTLIAPVESRVDVK